jgi:Cys-tRNA(Pro)/Cys-tRNA(Cys) deacylase
MVEYDEKLKRFIQENQVRAEHLRFDQSCHSVAEAAEAVGATPEDLVKSICMIDSQGDLIVAIVSGTDRVSTSQVGKVLDIERPRIATPDEILEKTGYPVGGTPSFGYAAKFLIDPRVMEKPFVYSGGGSANSLARLAPTDMLSANKGKVVKVRK